MLCSVLYIFFCSDLTTFVVPKNMNDKISLPRTEWNVAHYRSWHWLPRDFHCSLVFVTPGKTLALVYEILLNYVIGLRTSTLSSGTVVQDISSGLLNLIHCSPQFIKIDGVPVHTGLDVPWWTRFSQRYIEACTENNWLHVHAMYFMIRRIFWSQIGEKLNYYTPSLWSSIFRLLALGHACWLLGVFIIGFSKYRYVGEIDHTIIWSDGHIISINCA